MQEKRPLSRCCHGNLLPFFFSPLLSSISVIFQSSAHQKKACSLESVDNNTFQLQQSIPWSPRLPVMPEVVHLPSMKPPPPSFNAIPTNSSFLTTTTTQLPLEQVHMQVHTMLIIFIFCVVCFLLLLTFFYAFCFHCSIGSLPKDSHTTKRCSLEHEDATYKFSSSDNQSVGNVV
ncbi:hypothetical protein FQN60_010335 [Etheostoma spectabile]|uniref:Uncharacterized protein n=1 Tax=Etheostoma spectabile TaxID=54343 RepID=A0A5J5D7S0_9PERO|nr:hypothetical protein FQN60_010335 [Etheostoma spectabile]